jgi:hypothetical protein
VKSPKLESKNYVIAQTRFEPLLVISAMGGRESMINIARSYDNTADLLERFSNRGELAASRLRDRLVAIRED